MVNLEIDGKKITCEENKTILQAAKEIGVEIPTLCYNENIESFGACRLCMVEIQKGNKKSMVAACCYPVEEGLIVYTNTEKVNKVRKVILELILANCPVNYIELLAKKYGVEKSRFTNNKIEPSYCFLCGLCVRYCDEIKKKQAIGFVGRGIDRKVELIAGKGEQCKVCRECYNLCKGGKFPIIAEEF